MGAGEPELNGIEHLEGEALVAANGIYSELLFQTSDPKRDATWGIWRASELRALGRLQRHADGELEVGGFWVHPECRGQGIARRLVLRVMEQAPRDERIWCIPLRHLTPFYRSCGLRDHDRSGPLPASIRGKLALCQQDHGCGNEPAVDLLVRPAET